MATTIRKCLSLSPVDVNPDGSARNEYDVRFSNNIDRIVATGTRWVKLWVRWDQAQPQRNTWYDIGNPQLNAGFRYIQALDEQIALVRSRGLAVMVQSYCFPQWANGTLGMNDGSYRQDRIGSDGSGDLKPLIFRAPTSEVGVNQAWGQWVRFLIDRYRGHGWSFMLDLLNEPNLQWWPQQSDSSTSDPWATAGTVSGCFAGQMMQTAQTINGSYGYPIVLGAPGTADTRGPSSALRRYHTPYTGFVTAVLDQLQSQNFVAHPSFIWTHHNYVDVRENIGASGEATRAAEVRSRIGRWAGWRGERTDVPNMWITESGAVVGSAGVPNQPPTQPTQAARLRSNWSRLGGYSGNSAGMEMWTNYLFYTASTYDSGLLNLAADGGSSRDALAAFTEWPGRQ